MRMSTRALAPDRMISSVADPIEDQHPDVHEDHVRAGPRDLPEALAAVTGHRDDVDVFLGLRMSENPSRTKAWSSAITPGSRCAPLSGSVAVTRNPLPSGPWTSVPSRAWTRSLEPDQSRGRSPADVEGPGHWTRCGPRRRERPRPRSRIRSRGPARHGEGRSGEGLLDDPECREVQSGRRCAGRVDWVRQPDLRP